MVPILKELQARLADSVPVKLVSIAGLFWLIIALQAIQPRGVFSFRVILLAVGVVAGMASVVPDLLGNLWMEEMFGLRRGGSVVDNALFLMLGAAPCEELAKLALFLPLVPILLIRRSRLEMLVTAGCVGLGFAVWKNLSDYNEFGPVLVLPRLLTSNFFHLALTGINGLAFCEMVRNPVRGFLPFIGTLALTVAAHGSYEALASLEHLRIMMIGAMVIYMLVALWFFRNLYILRHSSTDQFSIGATFIIGISLLASTLVVMASRQIGFYQTMTLFAGVGFGMIMVAYMFYWQLGEGMSAREESIPSPYYR